jgi:hypothetical protein
MLVSAVAWTQAVSGTLSGRVTNATGTGVPDAAVTITNSDTSVSQRVLTGPDGSFSVAGLSPGTYRVEVETAGFKRSSQQNILLSATAPATVNITLEAGSMTETVEIKGVAPNIQTQHAEQSLGVPDRVVRELPVIDRSHQQLVELQTGIMPPSTDLPLFHDPARNRFFSTNGQDPRINLWHMDGVDNHEPFRGTAVRVQPQETVQQMNISSGSWQAPRGFTGGSFVNNITRGGTNDWHGSLFAFHSNNRLRSRSPINNSPAPKPRFTYNQFGGTIGGPIVRDKTFLFGSYEGTYNRGQNTVLTSVPTPEMVAGNFSGIPGVTIYNPFSGLPTGAGRTPFVGNMIPPAFINPTSAAVAAAFPAANLPGMVNNYTANLPYENDWQKLDGRLDQHFTDRTSFFVRYGFSNLHAIDPSLFGEMLGGGGRNRVIAQNAVANVTHSFTPSLITEFRAGYNRYRTEQASSVGTLGYLLGYAGGLPNMTIPGLASFGGSLSTPMRGIDNNFNLAWDWAWRTSRHSFKIGVDLRRFRSDGFYGSLLYGQTGAAYFGGGATSTLAAGGFPEAGSFPNAFASFLLGAPSNTGAVAFSETPTIRQSWYGLHISDTVQLHRRVALDFGVRYDVFTPLEPRRDGGAMFYDPDFNTLNFAGMGDTGIHVQRYDLNNVGPRVGLAISATDKTVIRAGYSVNYFQVPYMFTGFTAPFTAVSAGTPNGFTRAVGGLDPERFVIPAGSTLTPGMTAPNVPMAVVPLDQETPYVQSFSFEIQQEFMQNMMLRLGYLGTLGRQLPYTQELNASQPAEGLIGLPYFAMGRTASTLLYGTGLNNNYNSLQVALSKRFAQGLAFQGGYTYGKALGYTSGTNNTLLNPFDRRANYGPMDYDRQHVLTINHLWQIPIGAGTQHLNEGVVGHVIGNWQIGGIFTWATGTPLTVMADPLFCNCPNMNVLANATGGTPMPGASGIGLAYLDPSAFSAPPAGTFGTLGRGSFRAAGYRNYDLSLFRSFPIREQYKLEFRGEVYNLTNTSRWMNPVTNLSAANFGQVSGTTNGSYGRQFNLALRLLF